MARGQWRPKLLSYAQQQPAGAVEAASRAALKALRAFRPPPEGSGSGPGAAEGPLKEALGALTALKGVGPATASALLSAARPYDLPYMGDEALAVAVGRKGDYTDKAYLDLARALRAKARALGAAGGAAEGAAGGAGSSGSGQGEPAGEGAGGSGGEGGGGAWGAADVERCLWAAGVLGAGGSGGGGGGAKGKAAAVAGGAAGGAGKGKRKGSGAGGAAAGSGKGKKRK
ncbi:hypothetical protein HYH03_018471 [Edaphochlamys debaryana]|uniref:Uncharacterized protein n=1 Tax=Edaphochlamys debaryana TaxID=47281 RepID=A0A835XGF0_9CHLO|nr:hypothetical protein HYH03_018471 [Edaphochlamys debaryana]|eukprot:KAG2482587.1 hypothetical protein HYH03_018471 [Edaphochlamys debaryana]